MRSFITAWVSFVSIGVLSASVFPVRAEAGKKILCSNELNPYSPKNPSDPNSASRSEIAASEEAAALIRQLMAETQEMSELVKAFPDFKTLPRLADGQILAVDGNATLVAVEPKSGGRIDAVVMMDNPKTKRPAMYLTQTHNAQETRILLSTIATPQNGVSIDSNRPEASFIDQKQSKLSINYGVRDASALEQKIPAYQSEREITLNTKQYKPMVASRLTNGKTLLVFSERGSKIMRQVEIQDPFVAQALMIGLQHKAWVTLGSIHANILSNPRDLESERATIVASVRMTYPFDRLPSGEQKRVVTEVEVTPSGAWVVEKDRAGKTTLRARVPSPDVLAVILQAQLSDLRVQFETESQDGLQTVVAANVMWDVLPKEASSKKWLDTAVPFEAGTDVVLNPSEIFMPSQLRVTSKTVDFYIGEAIGAKGGDTAVMLRKYSSSDPAEADLILTAFTLGHGLHLKIEQPSIGFLRDRYAYAHLRMVLLSDGPLSSEDDETLGEEEGAIGPSIEEFGDGFEGLDPGEFFEEDGA